MQPTIHLLHYSHRKRVSTRRKFSTVLGFVVKVYPRRLEQLRVMLGSYSIHRKNSETRIGKATATEMTLLRLI
jgi:hypothetical protein